MKRNLRATGLNVDHVLFFQTQVHPQRPGGQDMRISNVRSKVCWLRKTNMTVPLFVGLDNYL